MVALTDFTKVSDYEWEIPRSFRSDMRVPVRIFSTRKMLEQSLSDLSVEQAINATTLPGVVGSVLVMPDMHQGYGFPIGGVAATDFSTGVISPGGIGYDINCGVRLLASQIPYENVKDQIHSLVIALDQHCPSGVGSEGGIHLTLKELEDICENGSQWALKKGYATKQDVRRTEENGCIPGANAKKLSEKAKKRGLPQLGTLGSGNHFIEIDLIEQVFDEATAEIFGLQQGNIAVMIHCGSRGLGHQVCSDTVQSFQKTIHKYGIKIPDRELVCAPLNSPEGLDYLAAMRAAANYAFCNRQVLAHLARKAFEQVLAGKVKNWQLYQVYDIAHNIGKIEDHLVDGVLRKVCVHRKGATRAFGPGSSGIPDEFSKTGQPVLVPGSMGTSSWVLAGTKTGMERSFGSSCHGAGRVMSRQKAKKTIRGDQLKIDLEKMGIYIQAGSMSGLAEEAPGAYKDVDQVIEAVNGAGLARKIARLVPLAVVKG
ncbi:MAG: RtcB family protein [Anaerolineaceae bacterium]|nr:RtcB family protein [Anaerolineaceae bacterium]